jgi:hypothetical protein
MSVSPHALKALRDLALSRDGHSSTPRAVPCSRCLKLIAEFQKHDASWMPAPAMTWTKEGLLYIGANCESCNWIEVQASVQLRMREVGDSSEVGIGQTESGKRKERLAALQREIERYRAGRRIREQQPSLTVSASPMRRPAEEETLSGWLEAKGIQRELTQVELDERRQEQLRAAERLGP